MGNFHYNQAQEKIIKEAVYHIKHGNEQVYQFAGEAGTGKTFTLKQIIKEIGIPLRKIAVMTYIGQAAIVLRTRGLYNAKTIHSTIYDCREEYVKDEHGNLIYDTTFNVPLTKFIFFKRDLSDINYFIIDEGWTVPKSLKGDIESFGKKIIVCGDKGQLPPVKDEPAYLVDDNISYLDEIMRQGKGSSIIYLAHQLRQGKEISAGYYGDVLVIEQKDLTEEMIRSSQILICGKNKTRDYYNKMIREDILGFKTTLPLYGEKIICRKNDWSLNVDGISLANGLIGQVVSHIGVNDFDGKLFWCDFKPDLLNAYFPRIACDFQYFISDYEKRLKLKNSRFSIGEKFEFAYANTTHLCQGAQYRNGIYISEYLGPDIQRNLDYTGITRFSDACIFVIPNRRKFF